MQLTAILLVLSGTMAAAPAWTPAKFRGLVVGSARRADVVRVLGSPDSDTQDGKGETLTYKSGGDHKGSLTIAVNRQGIVVEIQEAFPVSIPRTQIYKEFGKDALTAHFSQATCAGRSLYRDPKGNVELTLFPARGIAVWADQYGYDFAAIQYVARFPGLARKPSCTTPR